MGKTYRKSSKDDREQEIFIRSKRRAEPDLRAIARALIQIAQAEVEAENAHRGGETLEITKQAETRKPGNGTRAIRPPSTSASLAENRATAPFEVSP